MSFDIRFDYRFDDSEFFTAERRAVLEQAGQIWSSYIQDDFEEINANETINLDVNNTEQRIVLEEPIDDILIFVSTGDLSANENFLAEGSFVSEFIIGSEREQRIIGADFEPWLGKIEFNNIALDRLYFDPNIQSADDIPRNQQDFLSLALHEIGHIFGIGTAPTFQEQVEDGAFEGRESIALNDGRGIPLDDGDFHIEEGFHVDDEDTDPLLDQIFTFGERNLPTDLDLAILSDIGYEINTPENINTNPTDNTIPVSRFFEFQRGFHFYTSNERERSALQGLIDSGELTYRFESEEAYNVLANNQDVLTGAQIDGALPVYRFFNRLTGAHLYTINERERRFIEDNLPNYNFEGEAYYAFAEQPEAIETIPLFRMLNTDTGTHLFTADRNEFDVVSSSLPQFQVEGNDGITFYVLE